MQQVIATYDQRSRAEQAVRRLEEQISITGLFVADMQDRGWRRKLHPPLPDGAHEAGRYMVVMIGTPDVVARARSLISDA